MGTNRNPDLVRDGLHDTSGAAAGQTLQPTFQVACTVIMMRTQRHLVLVQRL